MPAPERAGQRLLPWLVFAACCLIWGIDLDCALVGAGGSHAAWAGDGPVRNLVG